MMEMKAAKETVDGPAHFSLFTESKLVEKVLKMVIIVWETQIIQNHFYD